ncbi:MAG: DUF2391 family protein [Leptospiraceae bacterium]|nr:DUF2391 family protein [Leptospiraceae bacterium]
MDTSQKNKTEEQNQKTFREVVRIGRYLNEIITIKDSAGNLIHKITKPLMVEFYLRDVVQVIVGATLLAIPVTFTEETWKLGETLPLLNVGIIGFISITFIGLFVYYNFYKGLLKENWLSFFKRVISTYFISVFVVGLILFLINKAPLGSEWIITLKRIVLISFPASMSAAVADMIK